MQLAEIDGISVSYDASGFGVGHQTPAVTSYALRKVLRTLAPLVPKDAWTRTPCSPVEEYSGLIWTPWHIANTNSTPNALSERIRMRSIPMWDSDQWENYALQGPYLKSWDTVCAPMTAKLALLARIFPSLHKLNLLEVGCGAGASLLTYAIHGVSPYGVEIDPLLVKNTSELLRDRVLWGDALYSLYALNHDFFDIAFVSCLGYVMSVDASRFFTDLWLVLRPGAPVILDLPKNAQEITIQDKVHYGPYIRPSATYRSILNQAGYTYTDTVSGLVIATKTHTPLEL